MIEALLIAIGAYLLLGVLASAWLLLHGLPRLDPGLLQSPKRVRLILLPGCVGLWPVLCAKAIQARQGTDP